MPSPFDRKKKIVLLIGDLVLVVLTLYLAVSLRSMKLVNVPVYYTGAFSFITFNYLISFYIFDLYNLHSRARSLAKLAWLILAVVTASAASAAMFYLFPSYKFGRGIFLIEIVLLSSSAFAWRIFYQEKIMSALPPKRIVIIGANHSGERIYEELSKRHDYNIKGFLDDDPGMQDVQIGSHKVIGNSGILFELCKQNEIDAAVIALSRQENSTEFYRMMLQCKQCGVEIYNMPTLFEGLTGKLPVEFIHDKWVVYTPFQGLLGSIYTKRIKKLLDVIISLTGLTLSLPLSIAIAIAIKLDSRGPVFFRQRRVGFDDKVFEIVKFRSMYENAESNGAVWAEIEDPRVTRIGRIIRKLRIDEIPQMWNVLKGEMSFIGPRPERPEFVKELESLIPYYFLRHSVKPGITGWAQINYRYGSSPEDAVEKLQYDLFYIKNLSFFLDSLILLKTIRIVLFGKGAR